MTDMNILKHLSQLRQRNLNNIDSIKEAHTMYPVIIVH